MNANLLVLAQQALGADFSKLAAQFLGESPAATQTAMSSLLPAVVGSIAQKGATPQGASGLLSLLNGSDLDLSSLGNIGGLFAGSGSGVNALLKAGTSSLVPGLFGDKAGALVSALSGASGVKSSSATNLLAMVAPLVLMFLKKFVGDKNLNAGSLSSLLSSQGPHLQGALDTRMTSALGFPNPAAMLRGLGGATADAARGAAATVAGGAAAVASARPSAAWKRWLIWLVGAGVLLFLWNQMTGTKPAATAPASAPAIATPPATTALPAKVYFDVGSANLGADGSKTLGAVAEAAKKDGLKLTVTGYTDKTGDLAANEALAKSRSVAVRDALQAAGVAGTQIELKAPMLVEVGATGGDAEARRVEVNRQ